MTHAIHRVHAFEVFGPHALCVEFEDGTTQRIDFSPVLEGEIYGPLRDPALFRQVRLDPEVHTLVWPNGADFDPADLHDWPQRLPAFAAMAKRWAEATSPAGGGARR